MKELEALEYFYTISQCGSHPELVEDAYRILKDYLTPPTADEVCKALSDYLRVDVRYDVLAKEFYVFSDSTHITKFGIYGYQIKYYLLPHLITLIGRFYEGY